MNKTEFEHLSRVTDVCTNRGRIIERQASTNDRQALMIYAKDRQIAELTRMLFALGKQDGQTIRELTEENRGLRQMLHMEAK